MKGVTSLSSRPSSCTVLKPPPPYSSYVAPSAAAGYGADTLASLSGYTRTGSGGVDDDDAKSRRRSRVCARSPGSAPPTVAAKTRRYKRPSSGVEHGRRQPQLQQSYASAAHRQLAATECHGWPPADSSYSAGTDYAAAAAACHSSAKVASCRYQTTAGAVRPPYRHDLLAVVPAIGPGETGPAAERLKQMAAHYQRLAATTGDVDSSTGAQSSYGCYEERYSYELYNEFAAQCQRSTVQPHYQPQSLYYDPAGYVADAHGYLTCNGVSQPPTNGSHSQYTLAEPEALSASHVSAPFNYGGSLGYDVADGVSRFMSPCAQQSATKTTTSSGLQAPASLYPSNVTSESSCQATPVSTAIPTTVCFAAESQQPPVDNFLEVYTPSVSVTMSTSVSSSSASPRLSSRRSSTSSTLQLTTPAAPVSARSSWTMAGDRGDVGASATWLTGQLDGVTTSPDVAAGAASFRCAAAPRGLDSAGVKPVADAELFSRQSSIGGIELY